MQQYAYKVGPIIVSFFLSIFSAVGIGSVVQPLPKLGHAVKVPVFSEAMGVVLLSTKKQTNKQKFEENQCCKA